MKKTHLLLTVAAVLGASIVVPAQASNMDKAAENLGLYMSMVIVASDHCAESQFNPGVQKRARHLNDEATDLYNQVKISATMPSDFKSLVQNVYNDSFNHFRKQARTGALDKICEPGQFADVETMLSVLRKPIEKFERSTN